MKLLRKGEKAAGNFGAAVSASWSSLLSSTGLSAAAISAAASRPTRLCPIEIEQACRSGPLLAYSVEKLAFWLAAGSGGLAGSVILSPGET